MSVLNQRWNQVAQLIEEMEGERIRFRVQGQSMAPTLHPGDEVVVERIPLDALRPGDLILIQDEGRFLLHRFLGARRRESRHYLLTSGDSLRSPDPLVPEEAFLGRAVAASRQGQALPLAVGRRHAWRHQARTTFWAVARRLHSFWPRRAGRALLLLLAVLALILAPSAQAAVTLVAFDAGWQGNAIRVTWETASEVDNMGFYVLRSESEDPGSYSRVTGLIPGEGDLVGAFYEWSDPDVTLGTTYYYKLEDVSASGGSTLWGPITVESEAPPPTDTPTPTPTPTDTPPPTSTPTPTPTPSPTPTFTPTPTFSPTPTPTFTPVPSATPKPTATSKPGATSKPATTQPKPTAPPSPTTPPPSDTPAAQPSTPPPTEAIQGAGTTPPTLAVEPSPAPTSTSQPSATPTAVEVALETRPEPGAEVGAESPAEEAPAPAERQRNVVLLIIGVGVLGGLLLVGLALVLYALYRWGYLRLG